MNKVKIAVIDNGVDASHIGIDLKRSVYIDSAFERVSNDTTAKNHSFPHGTICAYIIKSGIRLCKLYSVKILDEKGKGLIDSLNPALEWCYKNRLMCVNLSLGTTHFRDKAALRDIVNHYANKGMVIVAASANNGHTTYPASFSNVIGVVAGETFKYDVDAQQQRGIDFTAPSNHEITIEGNRFKVGNSNSYATPYVTALIGKVLCQEPHNNICTIREKLSPEDQFIYSPDWIESAWVSEKCVRSKADYYFKQVKGTLEECLTEVDSIILSDAEELEKYRGTGKHIVFLGNTPVSDRFLTIHFWSREYRLKQIFNSRKRAADIDIPIIVCELSKQQDIIYWFSELKKNFAEDGYNAYTVCNKPESALYDLEYLPEELWELSCRDHIYDFLYWQTYFCQSDILLLGIDAESVYRQDIEKFADMVVVSDGTDDTAKVKIYCDGCLTVEENVDCLDGKALDILYQKILELFAEDSDLDEQ